MTDLHRLLTRQIARCRRKDGEVDTERLFSLISESYKESDDDRQRTDHAIRMLVEDLNHQAEHDGLTGLANRTRFTDVLTRKLKDNPPGGHVAVMFLDLDHFKEVNDTIGHHAGDELLRHVARRLSDCIGERGLCSRLGGDEFAVTFSGVSGRLEAAEIGGEIVRVISKPYDLEDGRVTIGTSVGIAVSPEHGLGVSDLLRRADMALYRAKDCRRGAVCFFEPEMDAALVERKAIEGRLRTAIANEEFELYYQPIVEAQSQLPIGYEALIRWNDPERGFISPAEFIPIAETTGLINPIGEWVIRTACRQALTFPPDIHTSINVSPIQLRSDNLIRVFEQALRETGLAPHRLEVEITETALLQEDARTLETLARLRALGLRLSLDDFGTGHTSLSYLQKFHFDKIKIDRSFCSSVNSNPINAALVRAVATLGRDLGIDVVAEGVETAQESRALVAEGCSYLQGFHFGRPASPSNITPLDELAISQANEALARLKAVRSAQAIRLVGRKAS